MQFQVITRVPDMTDDRDAVGNLAACFELWESDRMGMRATQINPLAALTLRAPVFHVGEILIVDGDGREIGYPGRKADKWSVTQETFDDAETAVERAREVLYGSQV